MEQKTIELLRNAAGAIDSLLCQMSQMQGMFNDEDGTIEAAMEAGEDTLAEIRVALLASHIPANRISERHVYILVEALSEIKASVDGESDQPIKDIIYGCIAEIEALPENKREHNEQSA